MDEDLQDAVVLLSAAQVLIAVKRLRERRRRRSVGVLPVWRNRRQQGDGYHLLQEVKLNGPLFFKYTRMDYDRFENLLNLCAADLQRRNTTTTIPPEQRLAMTLRYLATGDSMASLSFAYRCGFATVSVIIRKTLSVIIHRLHKDYVSAPKSSADWRRLAQSFYQNWNLPHCLGAIDGRHMTIQAPKASGSEFFNYKKMFSIILLAFADADYLFTAVDVGVQGSQNDAAVLNNSAIWKKVQSKSFDIPEPDFLPNSNVLMPYFFVGDGIFQLQEHLMKPFAVRKLAEVEAIYNYRISRARRVVENAFGILVARWRIFRAPICCNLDTAENIVLATVCLHNYIMKCRDREVYKEYNPPHFLDVENIDGTITPGKWREMVVADSGALVPMNAIPRRCSKAATTLRKNLMNYVNNEGAVDWQSKLVRKGFWGAHITADIPVYGDDVEDVDDPNHA